MDRHQPRYEKASDLDADVLSDTSEEWDAEQTEFDHALVLVGEFDAL